MNPRPSTLLLRITARGGESELEILRLTHDLSRGRLWTPAKSDPSLNNSTLVAAQLAPAGKLVRGPGDGKFTLRQHRQPGRRVPQTIFPGSGIRRSGRVFLNLGGRQVPAPPSPPYPRSVPMGRRHAPLAAAATHEAKNGTTSCAKLDNEKRLHATKTGQTRSPARATSPTYSAHD